MMLSQARKRKLIDNGPGLLDTIDPSDKFLTHLTANKVISPTYRRDLEWECPSKKICLLVDYLERGSEERYEGFVRGLRDTGQTEALCLLDEGTQLPADNPDTEQNGDEGYNFRAHCQYYTESLGNVPFPEHPTGGCFNLEDVFMDPHFRRVGASNKTRLLTQTEVLRQQEGNALAVLIVGRKGCGKSTFLKHCAITWAKGTTAVSLADDEQSFKGLDLVVYIDSTHEGKTWKESFLRAVKGSARVKEQAWSLFLTNGPRVAVLVDDLDNFSNQSVINDIFDSVINRHCHMLIACQYGHDELKGRVHHFKLHAEICALKDTNLQEFIAKYAKVCIPSELIEQNTKEMLAWLDPQTEKGQITNQLIGLPKGGDLKWPQAKLFGFLMAQWDRYIDGCWLLGAHRLHRRRLCGS